MTTLEKSAKQYLEKHYNNENVAHDRDEIYSTYDSLSEQLSTFTYEHFLRCYNIGLNVSTEKALQFLLLKDNAPYFTDKTDEFCECYGVLSKYFALFAQEYL